MNTSPLPPLSITFLGIYIECFLVRGGGWGKRYREGVFKGGHCIIFPKTFLYIFSSLFFYYYYSTLLLFYLWYKTLLKRINNTWTSYNGSIRRLVVRIQCLELLRTFLTNKDLPMVINRMITCRYPILYNPGRDGSSKHDVNNHLIFNKVLALACFHRARR